MQVLTLSAAALALVVGTTAASAAGCSPGVGLSCVGEILATTQPFKFGARRPAIVKAGKPLPAGATFCFNGQSRIGRTLYLYVAQSDLMVAAPAVTLPTGCKLDSLDTSEPD